ncbi:MAG TPA: outer membrane beta-barrel protein [Puia sp.]|nr:outer membrane beta-barrel protein [Puia sp.]
MKESNFYSDEFEQLIREKTEQYKMYPSEKVWKGVHNSLHTKRKWFIGSMAILVGGILFLAGRELINPSPHPVLAMKALAGSDSGAALSKTPVPAVIRRSTLTAYRSTNSATAITGRDLNTGAGDEEIQDQAYKGITITLSHLVISQPDLSEFLSHAVKLPDEAPALAVIPSKNTNPADAGLAKVSEDAAARNIHGAGETGRSAAGETERGVASADTDASAGISDGQSVGLTARSVLESLSEKGVQEARDSRLGHNLLARTRSTSSSSSGGRVSDLSEGRVSDSAAISAKASATTIAEASDRERLTWLHDYAMYTLPTTARQPRTYLQLTLAPTVNYRTLSGGDFGPGKFIPQAPVSPLHLGDAQRYVDHSPAIGFQVGGSVLYRVTRNLSIKGGLQFNFSQYKIKAYASNSPQQATIALSSYYGYIIDSLTSYTRVGNFGGRTQETYSNDYYQLSVPLGFELRVLGNERLQFNIGATIQPSYLLNTNSYMLTSDYTGYTKEPSLFRHWNFNGGLEAFLTYKIGGIRLQAGPEFRYQLLSTYTNQYHINENLKGYGFKLGIVKELP